MEGYIRDRRAAYLNRHNTPDRGNTPGTADLDIDITYYRYALSRFELIGNCPARMMSGIAELLTRGDLINLNYESVNFIWQLCPL